MTADTMNQFQFQNVGSLIERASVKWLKNKITGVEGVFIKEFTNYYGTAILIKTDEGREYYAPKNEFLEINSPS